MFINFIFIEILNIARDNFSGFIIKHINEKKIVPPHQRKQHLTSNLPCLNYPNFGTRFSELVACIEHFFKNHKT